MHDFTRNVWKAGQELCIHLEKAGVLSAGLDVSNYINVDDTGARHAGKNGYCTHIGNEFFAWFESTESKSLRCSDLQRGIKRGFAPCGEE